MVGINLENTEPDTLPYPNNDPIVSTHMELVPFVILERLDHTSIVIWHYGFHV